MTPTCLCVDWSACLFPLAYRRSLVLIQTMNDSGRIRSLRHHDHGTLTTALPITALLVHRRHWYHWCRVSSRTQLVVLYTWRTRAIPRIMFHCSDVHHQLPLPVLLEPPEHPQHTAAAEAGPGVGCCRGRVVHLVVQDEYDGPGRRLWWVGARSAHGCQRVQVQLRQRR